MLFIDSKNQSFIYRLFRQILKFKWCIISFYTIVAIMNLMGHAFIETQIINFSIIFLPLVLISKIRFINIIIAFILSTIIGLELIYFFDFGERVSTTILSASVDTFFSFTLKVSFIILLKALPIIIILCFLFIKSTNEIKKLPITVYFFSSLILLSFVSFNLYNKYQNTKKLYFENLHGNTFTKDTLNVIKNMYYKEYSLFFGDTFYLLSEIYSIKNLRMLSFHDAWPEGIILSNKNKTPTKIILIIGESSISTHYSLYGYPFKTTPKLDKLYENNEISVIKDIVSSATVTKESLRLSLSFATPLNGNKFFQYKNIVEMANMAGYNTVWISSTY